MIEPETKEYKMNQYSFFGIRNPVNFRVTDVAIRAIRF
jgi:hypothetical protein